MALISLLVMSSTAFTSCKDEDDEEGASSDLVGTWVKIEDDVNDSGTYYKKTYDVSEEEEKITFNADGTCHTEEVSGTYTYVDGWLTVTLRGKANKFKILSLTSSEFVRDAWAYENYTDGSYAKATFRKIS
ncbi:MAG: hypothetical protein LBC40_08705 [Dysgonamonadaceae bacterium]|nr:hypothetical protein [Dysgonamonadaceae bacterium]